MYYMEQQTECGDFPYSAITAPQSQSTAADMRKLIWEWMKMSNEKSTVERKTSAAFIVDSKYITDRVAVVETNAAAEPWFADPTPIQPKPFRRQLISAPIHSEAVLYICPPGVTALKAALRSETRPRCSATTLIPTK